MTPQLISLIISLLAVLIVVVHVLFGMMRGLKKSVFRLIWIFAFAVICLFISKAIANVIVNMDFSFLHITYNGQQITTLPAFIEKMLENSNPDIANMISDNPEIMQMCIAIATSIATLVMFELLFWLTKILLWPLWGILSLTIPYFKNKKKIKTEGKEKVVKQKKHVGFGALVGLGVGVLVCLFTFIPVTFVSSTLMQIEAETTVEYEEGTQQGVLSQFLGDNKEWIMVYENSALNKVFRYTGMEFVQNGLADILTTANVAGTKISAKNEVSNLTPVYVDYTKIVKHNFNNLSQGDVNNILELVDDAQARVLSSNLVKTVYDKLGPHLAKNIITNENYFIRLPHFQNEQLDDMMRNAIRAFFGYDEDMNFDAEKLVAMKDIKNDISKLIDIAKKLNNEDLVLKFKNNQITIDLLKQKITVELSNAIIDDIFELKTLTTLIPVVIEPGIKFGIESLPEINVDGTPLKPQYTALEGGIQNDDLKQISKNMVESAINVLNGYDENLQLYIKADNFSDLGKILDQLKTEKLISLATYNSLLEYGEGYLKNLIDKAELNNNLKNIAKDIVVSISEIGRFETEFEKFGNAYNTYLSNGKELSVENIAKILDNIKSSVLYTENIDSIITNGTVILQEYFSNSNLPISADNLDDILEGIKRVNSFVAEYNVIDEVINFVKDMANSLNPGDEFLLEDNIKRFGKLLDDAIADGSVLLSKSNCKLLVKSIIQKINIADGFDDHKAEIIANVDNIESFENEFKIIFKIINIQFDTLQDFKSFIQTEILNTDGTSKSAIVSVNLIYNLTIDIINHYDFGINNIKDDIVNRIEEVRNLNENILNVINEIEALETKIDEVSNIPEQIADANYLINLGDDIDKLTTDFDLLINNEAKAKVGEYIANEINENIQTDLLVLPTQKLAVQQICNNIENYTSFKQMFTDIADALGLAH